MLLSSIVPKIFGIRACIPSTETISPSSSSSSGPTSSRNRVLQPITLGQALQLTSQSGNIHEVHCLLFTKVVDNDVVCFYGLGQTRYDGLLGFPGGTVGGYQAELREPDDIVRGLERELIKQINYSSRPDDNCGFIHISSYIDDSRSRSDPLEAYSANVHHFYAKEISQQQFKQCETSHFRSMHFPLESLGLFRIPLIDPVNCSDQTVFRYYKKDGGFLVNFFKSQFAGIAKNQLFDSLFYLNCFTPEHLIQLRDEIDYVQAPNQ